MKIAIIGAGPSGICAGKEVRHMNPHGEIVIFEAEKNLGGTFSRSYDHLTLINNPLMINFVVRSLMTHRDSSSAYRSVLLTP